MKIIFFLCLLSFLSAEVRLIENPSQGFNTVDNYANRIVYFFILKNNDGSVTLQVEPPPFYPSNASLFAAGTAYIDCPKVLKHYTLKEVATLTTGDITFTVKGKPNPNSLNGYSLYAIAFPWLCNLDVTSPSFYAIQSTDNVAVNPNIGGVTLFSTVLGYTNWVISTQGVYYSSSLTDNVWIKTIKPNHEIDKTITITVDLSAINQALPGIYSMYFFFQMNAIDRNQTFPAMITNLSNIQQTQLNYLTQNITIIDSYLIGNNNLYDPSIYEKSILVTNRKVLFDQYKAQLEAISKQWAEFAAYPNLSSSTRSIILNMQAFLVQSVANLSTI